MALVASLRRLARLGFWVGVSAGAMLVDACSSSSLGGRSKDAGPDTSASDSPRIQLDVAAKLDGPSVDGGAIDGDSSDAASDLWDTICE